MRNRIASSWVAVTAFALLVVTAATPLHGQGQGRGAAAPTVGPRDISGFWELANDSLHIPPADLVPGVTRAVLAERAKADVHAVRWCHSMGLPMAMSLPRPIELRVGLREVYVVFEGNAVVRHIYMSRTTHINPDEFDPSTNGDSIGRWEGDTLVVSTQGFHGGRGITAVPGGGFRTLSSRLTERFRLMNNGAMLSVVSTWTDPKVFRRPHTYEFRYYRLPDTYEPRAGLPCDAYDKERLTFIDRMLGVSLPAANAAPVPAATPAPRPAAPAGRGRGTP